MTGLFTPDKKVVRLTAAAFRGRNVVVELAPHMIYFRLRRTKTRYPLSIVGAFEQAVRIAAHMEAKERKARRAERAKLRRQGLL